MLDVTFSKCIHIILINAVIKLLLWLQALIPSYVKVW